MNPVEQAETKNAPAGARASRGRWKRLPLNTLHRLEQFAHLDAQRKANTVERFDRGRVLAEFDLRQVAQRDARLFRDVRQGEVHALAAVADRPAEGLAEGFFGHPQEALALKAADHDFAELVDLE